MRVFNSIATSHRYLLSDDGKRGSKGLRTENYCESPGPVPDEDKKNGVLPVFSLDVLEEGVERQSE